MSAPLKDQPRLYETPASPPARDKFRHRHPVIFWGLILSPVPLLIIAFMALVLLASALPDVPSAASPAPGSISSTQGQVTAPAPQRADPTKQYDLSTPTGKIAASDAIVAMGPLKTEYYLDATASEVEIRDWVIDVVFMHCNPSNRFTRFDLLAPNIIADPVPGNSVYDLFDNCATIGTPTTQYQYMLNPVPNKPVRQYDWVLVRPGQPDTMATVHLTWRSDHWLITAVSPH